MNITDESNVGIGGVLSSSRHTQITVMPVNDPPEIILDQNGHGLLPGGGALVTDEDTPLSLELLSVNDVEMSSRGRGRLVVSLECSNGGFALVLDNDSQAQPHEVVWAIGGAALGAGDGPWPAAVFSGELFEVNRTLQNLEYIPGNDWHGVDNIMASKRRHIQVER